jgi:superfamily I DNA/RNA helicase
MVRPSFIYDASAGSGKTYALVLKILVKKKFYRNILAITFTNKAVHEKIQVFLCKDSCSKAQNFAG